MDFGIRCLDFGRERVPGGGEEVGFHATHAIDPPGPESE